MDLIIGLLLGLALAWAWQKFVIWHTLRLLERDGVDIQQVMDDIRGQGQSQRQPQVINARMEEHQGQFYLYHADTNEFIAQGATAQDLDQRTDQRYGHQPVVITDIDPQTLERYRSTKTTS